MNKNLAMMLGAALVFAASLGYLWWWNQPCREGCNVVLIMVDTLSAQHLATYGYDRDTMPKVTDFFEKNGVIFENANSVSPWTLPSFTSMYFSDLPSHMTYEDLENGVRPSLQTELRSHGKEVRAVIPGTNGVIFDVITRRYKKEELHPISDEYGTVLLAQKQLAELATSTKPFFLLVHTFEAHDPYQPRSPYNELFGQTDLYPVVTRQMTLDENLKAKPDTERTEVYKLRYDQQISQTDNSISEILNSIPEEIRKKTVIILSADHGEAFNEHGILNHAATLFQEEIHIPLMMAGPGIPQGKRVTDPVSLLDMAPTILSVMGIRPPSEFKGENLIPAAHGRSLGNRVLWSMNGRPYYFANMKQLHESLETAGALGSDKPIIDVTSVGVRIGMEHAFLQTALPEVLNGLHWYDLTKDPEEKTNLASGKTTDALPARLAEELKKLTAELPAAQ
jgi:arylsulfatase A-like enzyme